MALHDTDITDKHKLLVPVIDFTSPNGISVEDEHGTIHRGDGLPRFGSKGIIYFDFPPSYNIKDKGEIAASVIFDEGTPFAGFQVADELSALSGTARAVLQIIEQIVC